MVKASRARHGVSLTLWVFIQLREENPGKKPKVLVSHKPSSLILSQPPQVSPLILLFFLHLFFMIPCFCEQYRVTHCSVHTIFHAHKVVPLRQSVCALRGLMFRQTFQKQVQHLIVEK